MATIKVLFNDAVVIKDKRIDEFSKYIDLKKEIVKNSKNISSSKKLTMADSFVLSFVKDKNNPNLYFPEELPDGIFSNPTLDYLKEKLSLRNIKEKYKFNVIKKDKMPVWTRKPYNEILQYTLDNVFKPIIDEIQKEVSLDKLEQSEIEYSKLKNTLEEKEKKLNKSHKNIICNNCFENNFKGKRFICSECNNYNLCQNCEKLFFRKQIHNRNHVLIQVNSPLDEDNNILKYNSIISNNNIVEKNDAKIFSYKSNCFNNGLIAWVGCYILPVRYGDEYLTCEPFKIEKPVEENNDCMINLKIQVPDTNKKYYEGYFRMFTPKGLPFGQLITIKVLRGENN